MLSHARARSTVTQTQPSHCALQRRIALEIPTVIDRVSGTMPGTEIIIRPGASSKQVQDNNQQKTMKAGSEYVDHGGSKSANSEGMIKQGARNAWVKESAGLPSWRIHEGGAKGIRQREMDTIFPDWKEGADNSKQLRFGEKKNPAWWKNTRL